MQSTVWSTQNKPPVGTPVIVNPQIIAKYAGVRFEIKSHRVKNVLLKRTTGGKDLIIDPAFLLPASTETTTTVEAIPTYPPVNPGTIVKVTGPGWKEPESRLFVVHTDNTYKDNTVRLSYLGGNAQYYSKVPRSYLTVVPLADLLAR